MDFEPLAFGRRVAAARVWAGLKPKELATRLGRSSEAINAIERGDRKEPPDRFFLQALAAELGQTEEWLRAGETPPWAAAASPGQADVLERARLQAIRVADELEALAELLAVDDDEAATG